MPDADQSHSNAPLARGNLGAGYWVSAAIAPDEARMAGVTPRCLRPVQNSPLSDRGYALVTAVRSGVGSKVAAKGQVNAVLQTAARLTLSSGNEPLITIDAAETPSNVRVRSAPSAHLAPRPGQHWHKTLFGRRVALRRPGRSIPRHQGLQFRAAAQHNPLALSRMPLAATLQPALRF